VRPLTRSALRLGVRRDASGLRYDSQSGWDHDQLIAEGPTLAADTVETAPALVMAGEPLVEVDRSHYQFEGELARGGMGVVRRARDLRTGRLVAVKELIEPTPQREARLEREARLTAQLQHPSIVPVYEVGRWQGGGPFFAMKLVGGRPLDEVVDEALDPDARLALVPRLIPAVEAIAYAHDNGVIHRDLKPANLLLGDFGETVVIDWGIAKRLDDLEATGETPAGARGPSSPSDLPPAMGPNLTSEGAVVGTPAYMSPEQATGSKLDARTDVYALGALLYHALSGSAPYEGLDPQQVLRKVVTGPPPPLAKRAPNAPADLVGIVNKAMTRDPAHRYADARALARDLEDFSRGRLVGAYDYSSWELLKRFARRHRALSIAVFTLFVVASVGTLTTLRANRVSERERERAVAAEQHAVAQERLVHERLAQVHWQAAVRRLQGGDHLGAEVLAAAALVEQPANPRSPHYISDGGLTDTERAARLAGPLGTWIAARALRFATRERVLTAHEDWLYDILPSPDGRWLVTTSADRRALIWNAREGTLHRALEGHEGIVFQAALSPDASELATSSYDGTVRTWSFPDGTPRRRIDPPGDRNYGLCYTPDGTLVVANNSGALAMHDASSGALLRTAQVVDAIPWRLTCSSDSFLAALGSTGPFATVLDLSTGEVVRRFGRAGTSVRGAILGDDGDVFTLAREGEVRRLDRETGEVLARANIGDETDAIALSPDGRFLAVGSREITVFDASTLRAVARLAGHDAEVVSLVFHPSSTRLYSGSNDHTVAVWELSASPNARRFMTPTTGRLDTLSVSPSGRRLASVGDEGVLRVWDLETRRALEVFEGHTAPIRGLLWLDESRLMTSAMAGRSGCTFAAERGRRRRWTCRTSETRSPATEGCWPSVAVTARCTSASSRPTTRRHQPTTQAGATQTRSTPGRSTQAGSTQAGSTQAGSTQAGSTQAGSTPARSTPAGSTQAGSTQAGSTPAGSTPAGSTQAGSTPAGSTPGRSTQTRSTLGRSTCGRSRACTRIEPGGWASIRRGADSRPRASTAA